MKKNITIVALILFSILLSSCMKEESNNTIKETKQNKNTNLKVEKVYSTSKNYAIVEAQNKIFIVNKDGLISGTIESKANNYAYQINDDGYVFLKTKDTSIILNKEGNTIYKSNDDNEYIYGISPDNYIIRKKESKYEVVDMDNKLIHNNINFDSNPVYLGGNYFIYDNNLYNIKTGKLKKIDFEIDLKKFDINEKKDYTNNFKLITDDMIILDNKILIKSDMSSIKFNSNKNIPINDLYYLNTENNKIYSYENYFLKKINIDRKIKTIFFKKDAYYLGTDDGYFYVLDKALNEKITPLKLGNQIRLINEYGVFTNKESTKRKTALYDFQGELIKDFDDYYLYDIQDFVSKSFIDGVSNNTPIFNLTNNKEFIIYEE